MIRILFLIDSITGGGAEKALRQLVNHMDQNKFEITVMTLAEEKTEGLLVSGIRYKAINRCKTAPGRRLFHLWVRLCAELKWLYPLYIRDDYDLEVAFLECGATKFLAGSTNKRAKKIAWLHCDPEKHPGLMEQRKKQKAYYGKYDRVVCVSEDVKKSFRRHFGTGVPADVLYNVIDPEEIRRKANAFPVERTAEPTFLAVGRLSREKGIDRLIDACGMLKKRDSAFRLWLVGDGPERGALENRVRQQDLQDRVTFFGFRENPYPFMLRADVLVSPSRQEGFSTVVTEALILGKPVVTTPSSGMAELLGDSAFGLITGDSTEGIFCGMLRMMEESALREHYGRMAALRGGRFSKEERVRETERFFEELLKEN